MSQYQQKRVSAMKNLKYYLIFCSVFSLFNIIVIAFTPTYSFPENFFALWPILAWGMPTAWRFLELRRYRGHG